MELCGVEVVFVEGSAERYDVVRHRRRELAQRNVEAVDEIDVLVVKDIAVGGIFDNVPPHVRHFVLVALRTKTEHIDGEDAEAVGVALLGVTAHQLLANADAEHRLLERTDHLVEAALTQVTHRLTGLALPWKQHLVSRPQLLGIVGQEGLHAESFQGVYDGIDITSIVFYNGDFHLTCAYQGAKVIKISRARAAFPQKFLYRRKKYIYIIR